MDPVETFDTSALKPSEELRGQESCDLIAEALSQRGVTRAGIYSITKTGEVQLLPIEIRRVEMVSANNENTAFDVTFRTSVFPTDLAGRMFLFLDGRAYHIPLVMGSPHDNGHSAMRPSFRGEDVYRTLGRAFTVNKELRKHPGHRFDATLTMKKDVYNLGEEPEALFRITNTGDVPFWFDIRLRQWELTATRNGEPFPAREDYRYHFFADEIGPVCDSAPSVEQDQSCQRTASLKNSYDFPSPGSYRVQAICKMSIGLVNDGDGGALEIWDEPLEFWLEFVIEDKE